MVIILAVVLATSAFATVGSRTVELFYNNVKIKINGNEVTPTDANGNAIEPFIIDGTTYLPVRGVASALGLDVSWDDTTKTVILNNKEENKEKVSSYENILNEYSKKLREATPVLIEEYNEAAKSNQDGLNGLATLCNNKVTALAKISNDGMQAMAEIYYNQGSGSYDEYSLWAGKIQDVYMEEAAKIQDAYMQSAQ